MKNFQKVYFREEAHNDILKGAEILATAVGSTMGPSGHSVIIDNENGQPKITKDGVTVAKSICLKNKLESIGAELLKEIADKTNSMAGDGTTSATVLGYSLLREGYKHINSKRSPIDLKKGMDHAMEHVLEFLKNKSIPAETEQQIENVATISANGDREIGKLITEAIKAVGKDGLIAIENGKSIHTSLKLAEGIQIDAGFLSPWFITNAEKQICEFENPYVLITPNKISNMHDIIPVLEKIEDSKRPLLIIADDIEGEALHTLVVNNTKKVIKVCAIKAPSYGEFRADILSDLGIIVGGEILGATSAERLDKIKLENLGSCKKVVVGRSSTMIIVDDNKSKKEQIEKRVNVLREVINTDDTLDDLRRSKIRHRLAKLSGGIAIIEVGGNTEVEMLEKRDRVEDAVNATQAAVQDGIVPGGGTALFYASENLNNVINGYEWEKKFNKDEFAGIQIVVEACRAPFNKIVSNTGVSPEVISERLKQNWAGYKAVFVDMENLDKDTLEKFIDESKSKLSKEDLDAHENLKQRFNFGYNAATKQFTNLIEDGILDPVKVTKYALQHAVSVVGLLLTCNAIVVNENDENENEQ